MKTGINDPSAQIRELSQERQLLQEQINQVNSEISSKLEWLRNLNLRLSSSAPRISRDITLSEVMVNINFLKCFPNLSQVLALTGEKPSVLLDGLNSVKFWPDELPTLIMFAILDVGFSGKANFVQFENFASYFHAYPKVRNASFDSPLVVNGVVSDPLNFFERKKFELRYLKLIAELEELSFTRNRLFDLRLNLSNLDNQISTLESRYRLDVTDLYSSLGIVSALEISKFQEWYTNLPWKDFSDYTELLQGEVAGFESAVRVYLATKSSWTCLACNHNSKDDLKHFTSKHLGLSELEFQNLMIFSLKRDFRFFGANGNQVNELLNYWLTSEDSITAVSKLLTGVPVIDPNTRQLKSDTEFLENVRLPELGIKDFFGWVSSQAKKFEELRFSARSFIQWFARAHAGIELDIVANIIKSQNGSTG